MPFIKVLARNWKIYIEDASTPGTFEKIGGLNSFTLGNDKEDTNTTDFDSNGYAEHLVSGRSNTLSVEGSFKEDETGARDTGQNLVEALAEKTGAESIGTVRTISPNGTIREFKASASIGDVGGGVTDTTSWGAEFTVSGKPTVIDGAGDTSTYNG